MVTISDLSKWVEAEARESLKWDEGVQFGDGNRAVERLHFCWHPDWAAIRGAIEKKADFLVGHESFFMPYNANVRKDLDSGWKDWPHNRERLEALERAGIGYVRYHFIADALTIFDNVVERLGLDDPVADRGNFQRAYAIEPTPVRALLERAKRVFDLPAVRVALPDGMDPEARVHRVGLPWGGMGLSVNISYLQELIDLGCDVFIAGETDNFAMRFATDQGIPMIETSHDVNEIEGFRKFAEQVRDAFPEVKVTFHEQVCAWRMG